MKSPLPDYSWHKWCVLLITTSIPKWGKAIFHIVKASPRSAGIGQSCWMLEEEVRWDMKGHERESERKKGFVGKDDWIFNPELMWLSELQESLCINTILTSTIPIFPSVFFSYSSTKAFIWSVNSCVKKRQTKRQSRANRAYQAVAAACFESCLKGLLATWECPAIYQALLSITASGKLRDYSSGQCTMK